MRYLTAAPLVLFASTSFALPHPNNPYREGANHHVGDDSFVARFGRAPRDADGEPLRMRAHLEHVRAWLGAQPATRPELANRRAELLGYLDDYIAKGITPKNARLPWRTPVFIDERGAICAVGYLIERSLGRALPEQIAAEHRHDFLETIAAAMPAVHAWIESSGFTLEELASIQPAYSEADVDTWQMWDLAGHPPPDGVYDRRGAKGTFARSRMEGTWTVTNDAEVIVGRGVMKRGAGAWTSFYSDGTTVMAQGPYVANRAHGAWKFFHPSGNLAAEGAFAGGNRSGRWRFYHDGPDRTPIATGRFEGNGHVAGRWRHFDAAGNLIATSRTETPSQWSGDNLGVDGGEGFVLDIVPGADRVRHQIHQGNLQLANGSIESVHHRLDLFSLGSERIYIHKGFEEAELVYDAAGFRLEHTDAGWTASNCRWAGKRKQIARSGDIARLHGLLYKDARKRAVTFNDDPDYRFPQLVEHVPGVRCGTPRAVPSERAARIDTMLASRKVIRAQSPDFVRKLVLGETDLAAAVDPDDGGDADDADDAQHANDLTRVLAANMVTYLQWPHVDRRFVAVFETLPGRISRSWTDGPAEE